MRTPIAQVRGLGSAKAGTGHFIRQRLTALANVPLVIAFIVIAAKLAGRGHAAAVALIASPVVALALTALMISLAIHMRLGMQTVIEDYVHDEFAKIACLAANTLFAAAIGIGGVFAIMKIALAG